MKRKLLAGLLTGLCACGDGKDAGQDVGEARPQNLVLIVLDTTRADHLGCYRYSRDTSPSLDSLAREGTLFRRAYAQASITPVSAATFLTGTYPIRHGVRALAQPDDRPLAADVPTLAETLRSRGLATAAFVSSASMSARYGLARGFEVYDDGGEGRTGFTGEDAYQRRGDRTMDLALDWLHGHAAAPFFLLLHLFDPHDVLVAPPRGALERWVTFPLPADLDAEGALAAELRRHGLPHRAEVYDAEIHYADAQVGRLLEALRALGADGSTLLAVIADHGEGLGDHGFWTHGQLYQEQLRVPLLLRGPGVPQRRQVDTRVRLADLAPTLAELLDAPYKHAGVDGVSLVPLLHGTGAPREVYAEVHEHDLYSVTIGPWKYIHHPLTGRHELYKLDDDPLELRNRYASDPATADALLARLQQLGALSGEPLETSAIPAEQLEMLRELGYF